MAEKLKIAKVEKVQVLSAGEIAWVTLHLTAHHLILVKASPSLPSSSSSSLSEDSTKKDTPRPKAKETWLAYPMIAYCTFRPTPPGSEYASSIRLRGRDFRFLTFNIHDDKQAREVFESIKGATCRLGSIEKLFAFVFKPPPAEKEINGWDIYDAKAEWKRQGISDKGVDRGWRISKINLDYAFSPTYPALLPVPSTISDNTLNYAGRYRSRVRIPVLTYLHPVNNCSITRSSQPLAGLRGNRSIQDEKLVSACFSACAQPDDGGDTSSTTISRGSPASSQGDLALTSTEGELTDTERLEDEMISSSNIEIISEKPHIYGAQQHNLIVDARPTVNALAMQAVGLGSENMDHYKFATKAYLGIDNIHVMRDSLGKVVDAIKDSDISKSPLSRDLLTKSGWLKHITGLLDGAALIARQVGIQHSHVLIHCSDGWDRTSQLSALAQLLLDPYYRTIDGFIVLIEKDWLAFGHMFQHRSGHLNSEKWFATQNDALAGSAIQPGGSGEGRGDALENALLSAKRFFNKNNNSQDAVNDSDGDPVDESPNKGKNKDSQASKEATKPKETSPVFHQFLDATYQLLHQFPTRFEFNELFLRRLLYHLYSCQYGTFLYNNEKSRLDARVQKRTHSVWGYILSRRAEFTNPQYDGTINDHVIGKERLLFPRLSEIRWWNEVFNRTDEEMNGHARPAKNRRESSNLSNISTEQERSEKDGNGSSAARAAVEDGPTNGHENTLIQPVLTHVETAGAKHNTPITHTGANEALGSGSMRHVSNGNGVSRMAQLQSSIAGLALTKSKTAGDGKSPANGKQPMEVEMQ